MAFKDTLLLPKTQFPRKPDLTALEATTQKTWEGLYGRIREKRKGSEVRVVHDGPPYANGDIHMGHLLNKVLKDFEVRYLTMRGYDSPFRPGWDCHGLPIESKVRKELERVRRDQGDQDPLSPKEVRDVCHAEAISWVAVQKAQFQRLGLLADWDNPYLTLFNEYERSVLSALDAMVSEDRVVRHLRPIHWCWYDGTALADAELEYKEITTESAYVVFPMLDRFPGTQIQFGMVAWTTTPWTLPGNVALAVNPELTYCLVSIMGGATRNVLVEGTRVKELVKVANCVGEIIGSRPGKDLVGLTYTVPFGADEKGKVVAADFVTNMSGTGVVHIAPAHGAEDFSLANKENLPIFCPVDGKGLYVEGTHDLLDGHRATSIETFRKICEILGKNLWATGKTLHEYPHCWRCKYPTITRATYQWFVDLKEKGLQDKAVSLVEGVDWLPDGMANRMVSLVRDRPDWCISRQRVWGVPIPAAHCRSCDDAAVLNSQTIDVCKDVGSDVWLSGNASFPTDLFDCPECGGNDFELGTDTLDVWFESGCSFLTAIPEDAKHITCVEGSDQHRGWFQHSLLISTALRERTPFDTVITHGRVTDAGGVKLSKSSGAPPITDLLNNFGAEVLRLFVCSQDYADDFKVTDVALNNVREAYYKIRNTFRYMLGNLKDFSVEMSRYVDEDGIADPVGQFEISLWILRRLDCLIESVTEEYDRHHFVGVYHLIYNFCIVDLSSIYFDVIKDRLYADRWDSWSGLAVRSVLNRIYKVLTQLIAPILPHTAEELWSYLGRGESVFLETFPTAMRLQDPKENSEIWDVLLGLREKINLKIEGLRAAKEISRNEEVSVTIYSDKMNRFDLFPHRETLRELCKLADVFWTTAESPSDDGIEVAKTTYPKCERCLRHLPDVKDELCVRCNYVVSSRTQTEGEGS